jgi:glycosyltransferase involved in cell wall biosynthesis
MPAEVDPPARVQSIMFLGGYHYEPNAQAAERLIAHIWPLIQRKFPAARLIIAGSSPENIPSFAACPTGVEFTGFVKDLTKLYARTRLVCSPIDMGGGTRIKLIEAAAWGKPIVSTAIGAEGLSFENGSEILIHNDNESIARECMHLLDDHDLCTRLGNAARYRALSMYEIGSVRKLIKESLLDGLRSP